MHCQHMEKPAIGHETCQEQLDLEMARYTCVNTVRADNHVHGVVECEEDRRRKWKSVVDSHETKQHANNGGEWESGNGESEAKK